MSVDIEIAAQLAAAVALIDECYDIADDLSTASEDTRGYGQTVLSRTVRFDPTHGFTVRAITSHDYPADTEHYTTAEVVAEYIRRQATRTEAEQAAGQ